MTERKIRHLAWASACATSLLGVGSAAGLLTGLLAPSSTTALAHHAQPNNGVNNLGHPPTVEPLRVEEWLRLKRVDYRNDLALTSDGRWVAYTVHDNRRQAWPGDADVNGVLASGNRVGYVDCDVWVTNTATSDTRNVTRGLGSSFGPAWSPDGDRLAFYSDRDGVLRVWVWERMADRVRRLSDAHANVTWRGGKLAWTPDGRAVVAALTPDSSTISDQGRGLRDSMIGPLVYRFSRDSLTFPRRDLVRDTAGFREPTKDLALLDAVSASVTRFGRGERVIAWWLSPDGRRVAFTLDRGTAPPASKSGLTWLRDIVTVDLESRRRTVVRADVKATDDGPVISFSPDGGAVAFTADGDCFVARLPQPARNVTPGVHEVFGRPFLAPVWDRAGRGLYLLGASGVWHVQLGERNSLTRVVAMPGAELRWIVGTSDRGRYATPDRGQSLTVLTRDTIALTTELYIADLSRGTVVSWYRAGQELDDPWDSKPRIVGTAAGRRVVFVAEDRRHPADLWTASALGTPQRLTNLNPWVDQDSLPGARVIEWHDAEGRVLRGVLMLPNGYGTERRYPLVVFPYPGELKSLNANRFGGDAAGGLVNMYLLTTRGYAVLLPDVPFVSAATTTDGRYRFGPDSTLMRMTWDAVAGGVDQAVALGIADPERVGIMGHSFGGYGVLSSIISTHRFRAAVALSGGYYDFPAQFLQLQFDGGSIYTKTSAYVLGGSLWERPAVYIANSPVFFLDRVTTPLLLVAGGGDEFSTPAQSAQVFVGLRTLGREVEYAVYPEEGHTYMFWTRPHQEDLINRVLEWFDKYLRGPG
jgi:dipeptidyl aminopeptidase/acylaminoacyl peptidase